MPRRRLVALLLPVFFVMGLQAQQVPAPSPGSSPSLQAHDLSRHVEADRSVLLDVIVRNKAGEPVENLQPSDFAVLDDKRPVPPADVRVSRELGPDSLTRILFVIDAVNSSRAELTTSEEALEGYLRAQGGRFEHPVTILVVSDAPPRQSSPSNTTALHRRQVFVHRIAESTESAVLAAGLKEEKAVPGRIQDAQGASADERVRLSLEALSFIANAQASLPGAKLVVWLGPGWPLLARSQARSSEQLFDSVIYFSNLLRAARMVLYAVSPQGVSARDTSSTTEAFLLNSRRSAVDANGHAPAIPMSATESYYEEFLKGVRSARQANPNDLALQVLARQTGGLVLQNNNDVAAQIRQCASDAAALYLVSFPPVPRGGGDVYHEVRITLAGSAQMVRTRSGVYVK